MALVVFTGGARSGKSGAAQRLAAARAADGTGVTVVVFGREAVDAEFADRVARHRAQRPHGWSTVEASECDGWHSAVADGDLVVVDCLGTLLGLCMERAYGGFSEADLGSADPVELPNEFEAAVAQLLDRSVEWLLARGGDTIVVTNEVGDGIVPEYATGRCFRDILGRANRRLVEHADAAHLCVCGRLVSLDNLRRDAVWPDD